MFQVLSLNNQKGFTMIELIITVAVLSFGVVGVYSVFSDFSMLNYSTSSRFSAVYLGQEGLEIIRNIRDNNFINNAEWPKGLTICGSGCQADYKTGTSAQKPENKLKAYDNNKFLALNSDGFYSYDPGVATIFKRKITISQPSADVLIVNVKVFWDYNGKPFSFETEGHLYNWY